MIHYKNSSEIELIRKSNLLVSKTLAEVARNIKPGVSLIELDTLAEEFIRSNNAVPGFKGYGGFPATLCMSLNEQVVHGIPTDYTLKSTDIISIDCGVVSKGFYGDSAFTFALSDVSSDTIDLLKVTNDSLYLGIEKAIIGNRIGDIGSAIQSHCESFSYGVVRELVGHGVGKNLHEKPEVPNYGRRGSGPKLKEGLVIAIEPMINLGTRQIKQLSDGWTIVTKDLKPSAHFEHSIAITKNGPDILSDHTFIREEIKNNSYLLDF